MSEEKKKTLKRTFGMREAVTITVGTVVGGWTVYDGSQCSW